MVAAAEEAGGEVRRAETVEGLGLALPGSDRLAEPPFAAVLIQAAVTSTLGGLRVDTAARVLREDGTAIDGLYAAGGDVGGVASGGYSSGLAAALVLGLAAAESAAADSR
jgi:predicted oxidoreductase